MSTPAIGPGPEEAAVGRTTNAGGGNPGRPMVARGSSAGQSNGTPARAWIERQEATTCAGTGASLTLANASRGAGSDRSSVMLAAAPPKPNDRISSKYE
jgi:hypothetical protein